MKNIIYDMLIDLRLSLGSIVIYIIYVMLFIGLWITFYKDIVNILVLDLSRSSSFRLDKKRDIITDSNKLYKHIELLLFTLYGGKSKKTVYTFFLLVMVIFCVSMTLLSVNVSLHVGVILSVIFSSLPYIYISMKLRQKRISSSYEAEEMIIELINQYKINYYNMTEAIDKAIPKLNNAPNSQIMLLKLSLSLKEYRGDEELALILKEFAYGVDTQWIKLLSNTIYIGISDNVRVTEALEDILLQLKEATIKVEHSKRINSEALIIAKYISPILYMCSIGFAVKEFNFTVAKFLYLQFNTNTGIRFCIIFSILMIINYCILIVFKRQKFDF